MGESYKVQRHGLLCSLRYFRVDVMAPVERRIVTIKWLLSLWQYILTRACDRFLSMMTK